MMRTSPVSCQGKSKKRQSAELAMLFNMSPTEFSQAAASWLSFQALAGAEATSLEV
jgi:hypothetical protein